MFYNNYELNRWYEETKFFIASILGCIVAIIAFIIFIVMFFKSKDKAKKRKYGIISMVMILTALFCGFICIDEFIYTQIYLWIVVVILCLGGILSATHSPSFITGTCISFTRPIFGSIVGSFSFNVCFFN